MKILVAIHKANVQQGAKHPHRFTPEHLAEIRKAADKETEIVATDDPEEAARHAASSDVIAGFPATIPPLSTAKRLKWLHSFSAGVDRILTPETIKLPILISNSSGLHATPIAEHLIGFMLLCTRGFYRTFKNQQKKLWVKDETLTELRDKTLLVVGFGDIGLETARLAHAFGMRVLAVSRTRKKKPLFVEELKVGRSLDALLPRADFVAICLPQTSATHHLFDMRRFRRMQRSAILMNIGRGGIVHERDLVKALRQKTIAGAALDVAEIEPLPKDSPLWDMENVIITPHHSGLSEKYMDRAVDIFCKNLKAFLQSERLPTLVDKRLGY